jgi:NAD(P)-dependent dehydrogenase (short-subunit alcohol dehydrogenase family)
MLPPMGTPARVPPESVALVTGASSGIGEASARRLAQLGYRVVLAARRTERLSSLAKEITDAGGEALPVAVDLADADATSRLVHRAHAAYGRIDLLVNNAGFSPGAALEQVSRDELRHIFEVNLFAALHLIGEVVPLMRAQGGGRIVNVGSLGGIVAAPLAVPYAATKSGLDAATRGLRLELAPFGIRLSLVIPGFVDTAVFDNARAGSQHLRDDPDNPYRKIFFDLDDLTRQKLRNALQPQEVAEVVALAATARRPRLRYYTPVSARLQTGFLGLLPERLVDRLLRGVYKLPAGP